MTKTVWFVSGAIIVLLLIIGGIFLYVSQSAHASNPTSNPTPNPIDNTSVTSLSVVQANNQFALELYKNWSSKDGNMFFSPYSLSSALAMTYEGAKGKTSDEMQKVLHFPIDSNTRKSEFSQINTQINNINKPYALTTANALWAQKDYPFLQDYLNLVEQSYGGKATNLDFKTDSEGSRKIINDWVENKTNNKIVDLIPIGLIDGSTRLVLTNAIYFKANWTSQFDKAATYDANFMTNSNTLKVPTMHQTDNFSYAESSDLQVLELPYLGNDLSMLILLPKLPYSSLTSVETSLDTTKLTELRNSLKTEKVVVYLPTFKMETKYFMKEDLITMGMPTAFKYPDADFTGISPPTAESPNGELYIGEVIHQAFVNVTESGTEAAAATAVIMGSGSSQPDENQPQPKIFKADHPFIFIIQQKDTGNILFIGRVSDPSKQ